MGPWETCAQLFSKERLTFTATYFGTLGATLYFTMGMQSTFLTTLISGQITNSYHAYSTQVVRSKTVFRFFWVNSLINYLYDWLLITGDGSVMVHSFETTRWANGFKVHVNHVWHHV